MPATYSVVNYYNNLFICQTTHKLNQIVVSCMWVHAFALPFNLNSMTDILDVCDFLGRRLNFG
jgi:hypothetical protein